MIIKTKLEPKKKSVDILFRCDKQWYLKLMLESGQIHFGRVDDWINSKVNNSDPLEGAFRFAPLIPNVKKQYDFFSSCGTTFARDKRVNRAFGFCLFGVGESDYQQCEEINDEGAPYQCCYLETSYLKPYKDIATINEYLQYRDEDKRKLIYITHPELLAKSIYDELKKFGFRDDEIFCGPVVYIDKYQSKDYDTFPACLFYKHVNYRSENEIRFIVSSDREEIVNAFLEKECNIEIGSIQRYAKIIDYPYENIQIKKEDDRIVFDTPNRFFLSNRYKTWVELCKRVILLTKRGLWIHKRQREELMIIAKILWEREGIWVNITTDESERFITEFINSNPDRNDDDFKTIIDSLWQQIN